MLCLALWCVSEDAEEKRPSTAAASWRARNLVQGTSDLRVGRRGGQWVL